MWIVVGRELVETTNAFQDLREPLFKQLGNSRGHHDLAAREGSHAILFIAVLHVFTFDRRHVPRSAVRTIVVAGGRPFVRPFMSAAGAAIVISEVRHDLLLVTGARQFGRRSARRRTSINCIRGRGDASYCPTGLERLNPLEFFTERCDHQLSPL